jgi:uncharacterized protein YpiB (UPF0302 family)
MLRSLEYGITPERVVNAIDKLLKYTTVEDSIIKDWLESTDYAKTLHQIDLVLQGRVSNKVWKLVKMW